ncbi:MAG: biotin--[acetyl-CoA-carboxylase] ligase [Candidatus Omnitrophica bacterium]|nr:biotin--[acetyl-CoA-carboxylase] ligase [Candidatus Omnitrophota bacterium]
MDAPTIDTRILATLRDASPGAVSGAELSLQLGISRAAVWARIEELRALGYEISASPHRGYCLASSPDRLHADDLLARLGRVNVVGRDVRVFQETTSTNDIVEKLARDGVKEGVVVFAESQTKGRGRLSRRWVSPPGKGLWFSVLLRPDLRPTEATQLMVAAATATARALRTEARCVPEIKWPNDVLLNGKKVAGILTEMSAELDHIKYLILGIGINANLDAGEFPVELRKTATSIKLETGESVDRPDLAVAILRELDQDYTRIRSGRFSAVADEWQRQCGTLGRQISIRIGDRLIQGCAESLDHDGALILRTQHGHLERIIGGDVTLEK